MTDGIILINKPEGITSFLAVAKVKRRLGVKCGHSGTLDPLATGLLPVMCGKATKLCQYLTEGNKAYRATLKFGIETDTHDITGNITATDDKKIALDQIQDILPRFIGKIKQVPPAYSAIKVDGTALYKLARSGQNVEVPEREINIYSIDIIDFSNGQLIMDVECSKGTYIRSLCRDIARALGTVGTMSALNRTKTGGWNINDAVSLECENIENYIIPIEKALDYMPKFNPGAFFARLLQNGCEIDTVKLKNLPQEKCLVIHENLLGIGEIITKDNKKYFKIVTHL